MDKLHKMNHPLLPASIQLYPFCSWTTPASSEPEEQTITHHLQFTLKEAVCSPESACMRIWAPPNKGRHPWCVSRDVITNRFQSNAKMQFVKSLSVSFRWHPHSQDLKTDLCLFYVETWFDRNANTKTQYAQDRLHWNQDPACNFQLQTSFSRPKESFMYPMVDCTEFVSMTDSWRVLPNSRSANFKNEAY